MDEDTSVAALGYMEKTLPKCLGKWAYATSEGEVHLSNIGSERHGFFRPVVKYSDWLGSIHVLDRTSVAAEIQAAVESGFPGFVQYRLAGLDTSARLAIAIYAGENESTAGRLIGGVLMDQTSSVIERQSLFSQIENIRAEFQEYEDQLRHLDEGVACYKAIVESAIDGIITLDDSGAIESVNPSTERIFGYAECELIGRNIKILMPEPYHSEHDGYLKNYMKTGVKKIIGIGREVVGRRKDGSTFPIDLAVTEVKFGSRTLFAGTIRDITDRRQAEAEIRELNEDLEIRVASRTEELTTTNAELDAFAYSVSHDLRAPLRHIGGFVELLAMDLGEDIDQQRKHYIDTITDSSRKMGALIDDLLAFSRMSRTDLVRRPIDCNQLINRVIDQLRPDFAERDVEWRIAGLPKFFADEALMQMVWTNLIQNALKFTRTRSPAVIQIGSSAVDEDSCTYYVRDNGVGFNSEYSDKLFGVFQRLHRESEFEGTGIGLAIVRRIVQRHGGTVRAEGSEGQGAAFYISLPCKGLL